MRVTIYTFSISTVLSAMAFGQTPNTAGTNSSSTMSSGQQSLSGVLLDANCPAISSSGVQSYSGPGTSSSSAVTTPNTGSEQMARNTPRGTQADMPRATGATATGAGTTGAYGSMGTAGGGSQAGMTGTNAGSATTTRRTPKGAAGEPMPSSTALDVPRTTGATATGAGTSGAYTGNGVAGSGASATTGRSTVSDTGERARTATSGSSAAMNTSASAGVGEKYAQCGARATTTAFAIHADGRIIALDDASNQMVRDRMSSGTSFSSALTDSNGNPKFMSVKVSGSASGDKFKVSSLDAASSSR